MGIITSSRGEPLLKQMRPKSNVSQKNAKKAPAGMPARLPGYYAKEMVLEVVCVM